MIEQSPGGLAIEESLNKTSEEESHFSDEQSLSYAEINPENVKDVYELLNQEISSVEGGEMDVEKFQGLAMERFKQDLEAFGVGTLEQKMLGTFWNMGNIAQGDKRRKMLQRELGFVGNAAPNEKRRSKIFREINELNIETASWQNEIVKLTFNLAHLENGRNYLNTFWSQAEKIFDPEEIKRIKSNVLGVMTSAEIFKELGFRVYLPTPEQDALGKIDLLGEKEGKVAAAQIKSHADPIFEINCTVLEQGVYAPYSNPMEKKSQDKLRATTSALKQELGVTEVVPVWIDLHQRGGGGISRDELTGIPALEGERAKAQLIKVQQILA